MSDAYARRDDVTERPPGGCDDCALADGPGCCGAARGATLLRSDRTVLALAGSVTTVIVLAVLTIPSSRHALVLVPALPTLLLALTVSGLGLASLRAVGRRGDRAAGLALRLLPAPVAGLLATLGAALVRLLAA